LQKKIARSAKMVLTDATRGANIQTVAPNATRYQQEGVSGMNVAKLKAKIVEREMNVETLASIIGVDRSSLYRKLNEAEKITLGEAQKMKEALKMTNKEASDIFLA